MSKVIYLGFVMLQHLETKLAKAICLERANRGPYLDLDDFIDRVSISLEQLVLLIRIGAFRFTTPMPKKELLWEGHLRLGKGRSEAANELLFRVPTKERKLPELTHDPLEDTYDEIELLGFPLCFPFDLLDGSMKGDTLASGLVKKGRKTVKIIGYLVTTKDVITTKNERMKFATFIDEQGDFFDTCHFPQSLQRNPFKGIGLYLIKGKVAMDFGFPTVEVHYMEKLPLKKDPRYL